MSSLSQFAPFAGGGIKSIQTGYFYGAYSYSGVGGETYFTQNLTISSVNTAKSISSIQAGFSWSSSDPGTSAGVFGPMTTLLTSSTNLRVCGQYFSAAYMGGRWYVVESN